MNTPKDAIIMLKAMVQPPILNNQGGSSPTRAMPGHYEHRDEEHASREGEYLSAHVVLSLLRPFVGHLVSIPGPSYLFLTVHETRA